jgi:hypothetical protein
VCQVGAQSAPGSPSLRGHLCVCLQVEPELWCQVEEDRLVLPNVLVYSELHIRLWSQKVLLPSVTMNDNHGIATFKYTLMFAQ